jgi:hypothetical protein
MNPITGTLDRLGTRNRELNAPVVGATAALYGARCAIVALLLSILGVAWALVYVVAVGAKSTGLQADSVVVLILLGTPLAWLAFRYSAISARLAADHFEPELGFRPRWWWCYSLPRGWKGAIERQKRWHARGRGPLIPW